MPYGTPCSQKYDPETQKLEILRCEVETLRARLDALSGADDGTSGDERAGSRRSRADRLGVVVPLGAASGQTVFDRAELNAILGLYGRMVAAGLWRDYAVDLGRDAAIFSAFRRAAERPEIQVEQGPGAARRSRACTR